VLRRRPQSNARHATDAQFSEFHFLSVDGAPLLSGRLIAVELKVRSKNAGRLSEEIGLPLNGDKSDYDALMNLVRDARFVLLGEATDGTHEF
jgi:hypothetical protein